MSNSQQLVQKLWNYCNVLRDEVTIDRMSCQGLRALSYRPSSVGISSLPRAVR